MVLIFILFTLNLFAETQDQLYLGEKNFTHYYDVYDPEIIKGTTADRVMFKDTFSKEHYLDDAISKEFLVYKKEFLDKMVDSLDCSNDDLALTYRYYRYSHRLITLSYLYEAFDQYDRTLKKLGEDAYCNKVLSQSLEKCSPKSQDMKVFLSNLDTFIKFKKKDYIDAKFSVKDFKKKWMNYSDGKFDLLHYRLSSIKPNNYLAKIKTACKEDLKSFKLICSEEDSLFGMSDIPETYALLVRSNVFNYFKNKVNVPGCLRRFKRAFKKKELEYENLKRIFPYLYQSLFVTDKKEGRIFALGTLKEFTKEGLALYKKKQKPVYIKKIAEKKLPVVEKISPKKIKQIVKTAPKKVKAEKKTELKPISISRTAFYEAQKTFEEKDLKKISVDMDKFRYDYIIPLSVKEKLDETMAIFLKQSSLKEMKTKDSLGSKKSALPLILIKYMVDYNKNLEIYNIINIIGEEFYVTNDIDDVEGMKPVKINLLNNVTTNYKWKMSIVK